MKCGGKQERAQESPPCVRAGVCALFPAASPKFAQSLRLVSCCIPQICSEFAPCFLPHPPNLLYHCLFSPAAPCSSAETPSDVPWEHSRKAKGSERSGSALVFPCFPKITRAGGNLGLWQAAGGWDRKVGDSKRPRGAEEGDGERGGKDRRGWSRRMEARTIQDRREDPVPVGSKLPHLPAPVWFAKGNPGASCCCHPSFHPAPVVGSWKGLGTVQPIKLSSPKLGNSQDEAVGAAGSSATRCGTRRVARRCSRRGNPRNLGSPGDLHPRYLVNLTDGLPRPRAGGGRAGDTAQGGRGAEQETFPPRSPLEL